MKNKMITFGVMALFFMLLTWTPACKKYEAFRFIHFKFLPQMADQYDWCWEGIKNKRNQNPPVNRDTVTRVELGNFRNCYEINILSETDRLLATFKDEYYNDKPWRIRDKKWTPERLFDDFLKPGVKPILYAFFPEFWNAVRNKVRAYVCDVVKGQIDPMDPKRRQELVDMFKTSDPSDYYKTTWGQKFKDKFDGLYASSDRPDKVKDGLMNWGIGGAW